MSPVFFIGKKDGGKQMIMDYHNLNSQTVKNNYLLPLITELIWVVKKYSQRWI